MTLNPRDDPAPSLHRLTSAHSQPARLSTAATMSTSTQLPLSSTSPLSAASPSPSPSPSLPAPSAASGAVPTRFPPPPAPASSSSLTDSFSPSSRRSSSTLDARTLPRLLDPSLESLADVTLLPAKSPGQSVRAHRFVLAAASPVLRASLTADPNARTLTLAHADADALQLALHVVYHKDAASAIDALPAHALWDSLATCVAYTFSKPLRLLQARIIAAIDHHNIFYHWGMAEKFALDPVITHCKGVVKTHFQDIARTPEFTDISSQRLARILRIHDLHLPDGEDVVFDALERWLAFDVQNRAEQALQLLRLVRLPTMSDRTLLKVCRSPYFGGHNEFYQLLLEALIRRTEVRIIHAPRIDAVRAAFQGLDVGDTTASSAAAPSTATHFKPLGITDTQLLPPSTAQQGQARDPDSVDYNRKEDRTVLFQGLFPLRWYKSVRFRPRSASCLLFSVVIPRWSSCRRRFISESRSFLNHKWSLWVDPFSSNPSSSSSPPSNTNPNSNNNNSNTTPASDDYISIYLCCESEAIATQTVRAPVDFALFVASPAEDFGMERKVCVGRTFRSHGQAMGFRRHTKRARLHDSAAMLYNKDKDELVVGAHVVATDAAASNGRETRPNDQQQQQQQLQQKQKDKQNQHVAFVRSASCRTDINAGATDPHPSMHPNSTEVAPPPPTTPASHHRAYRQRQPPPSSKDVLSERTT